jgi:hypothetical protein
VAILKIPTSKNELLVRICRRQMAIYAKRTMKQVAEGARKRRAQRERAERHKVDCCGDAGVLAATTSTSELIS